jgi:menaquinone-9 beta-reductase
MPTISARVPPTLSLTEAKNRTWDVIVIGAGPAGAMAAYGLARHGVPVLLVDRAAHPRSKVCGSCLNMRALSALADAGLAGLMSRLGAVPLTRVDLATGSRHASLALPGGVALSRGTFDAALIRTAIDAGANFLPETDARLGPCKPDGRTVMLRQAESHESVIGRVVLAADGLGGRSVASEPGFRRTVRAASRIGAAIIVDEESTNYPAGTIHMACGRHGYVGLVRLEDGRLNVAAALDVAAVRRMRGVGPVAAATLTASGLPQLPGLAYLPWRGTPALTQRLEYPAAERLFVIGDAAGYVEPFTGDGMAGALESGLGVVPFAVRACAAWESELADQWVRWHAGKLRQYQQLCRTVTGALRHPLLVQLAVMLLARLPMLAAPVVRRLNHSTK